MDLLIFLIVFLLVNYYLIQYAEKKFKKVPYVDRTKRYTSNSDLEEMRRMVNSNNSRF